MKKKNSFVAAVFIGSQLFVNSFIKAQEPDSTGFKNLNVVTVIGTRTEKKLSEVPKSVTVFTSKDIESLPYQNVADLLSRSEGIFATGTFQTPGSLQYLFLRGADARHTLIMMDGVKMSDAATPDNSLDLSELSLANVERIEIVRGSQGTLYGSSAIGGSINIITRKGRKAGFTGNLKSKTGNFGKKTIASTNSAGLGYTAKSGWYINGEYLNSFSNGLNATTNNGTNAFGFQGNERDHFYKQDVATKTGFTKNGWDIYAGYRKVKQENDIDDGAYKDDENYVVNYDRELYSYGISKKLNEGFSIQFFGGYTNTDRKADDDSSLISSNPITYDASTFKSRYNGKYLSNEVQADWELNRVTLIAGAGFTGEKMNVSSAIFSRAFNYTSESDYDSLGIKATTGFFYARGDWRVEFDNKTSFNLAGGLRYSNHNQFGDFLSFEINPSFKASANTLVFANFSRGFNAPSLYQQYAPETDFSSGISRGNSKLNPEKSFTTEFGFRSLIENVVLMNLSIYKSEVKDFIDYVYLWEKSKPTSNLGFNDYKGDTYLNLGKMESQGFELGTHFFLSKKIEASANISINIGKLKYEPSSINQQKTGGHHVQVYNNGAFLTEASIQKQFARRPSSIVNLGLIFKPTSEWSFHLDSRSVGSRPDVFYDPGKGPFGALARNTVDGFSLFNLAAFFKANKNLNLQFQLNNILNKKYVEINGFSTLGRSVWLGVGVSL